MIKLEKNILTIGRKKIKVSPETILIKEDDGTFVVSSSGVNKIEGTALIPAPEKDGLKKLLKGVTETKQEETVEDTVPAAEDKSKEAPSPEPAELKFKVVELGFNNDDYEEDAPEKPNTIGPMYGPMFRAYRNLKKAGVV